EQSKDAGARAEIDDDVAWLDHARDRGGERADTHAVGEVEAMFVQNQRHGQLPSGSANQRQDIIIEPASPMVALPLRVSLPIGPYSTSTGGAYGFLVDGCKRPRGSSFRSVPGCRFSRSVTESSAKHRAVPLFHRVHDPDGVEISARAR